MPQPERETILAQLNDPDPLQCILAAAYLTDQAHQDLMAFRIDKDQVVQLPARTP
jgi:hypothetical protein